MKFVDFLSYVGFIFILSACFSWLILGWTPIVLLMFWAGVVLLVGIILFAYIAAGYTLWQRSGY